MVDRKAYACMEPYENTGAVIFARSNIEARRWSADEFHGGDIGGMSVKRAPWADKYGSRHNVPISVMVDHGWHFECAWSGSTIDSDGYNDGIERYDYEKKEYYWDETCKGKEPVGFQEGLAFACQEYADAYHEEQRKKKEFEEEWLKYYRGLVFKNFPDAILINSSERFGQHEYINSEKAYKEDVRVIEAVTIPFEFPGMNHWAALELRREPSSYSSIGPMHPHFTCARGDLEGFEKWAKEQKSLKKVS